MLTRGRYFLPQLRPDQPDFVVAHLGDPIDKKAYAIRRKKTKPEDEQPPSTATGPRLVTAGTNDSAASGSTSRMHSLHSSPIVSQTDQLFSSRHPLEEGSVFHDHRRTSTLGSNASNGQFRQWTLSMLRSIKHPHFPDSFRNFTYSISSRRRERSQVVCPAQPSRRAT
jgi:hypothetical protein